MLDSQLYTATESCDQLGDGIVKFERLGNSNRYRICLGGNLLVDNGMGRLIEL